MTVRPADPTDAEGIARAHTASWQVAYRGIFPDDYLDGLRWQDRQERWAQVLTGPSEDRATLVAVAAGTVIGLASIGPSRDEDLAGSGIHELYAVYLDPARWRQGVGSMLLRAALELAPSTAPAVTLWVLEANVRARQFYQRHGFAPDGGRKQYDGVGPPVPELRYRRPCG